MHIVEVLWRFLHSFSGSLCSVGLCCISWCKMEDFSLVMGFVQLVGALSGPSIGSMGDAYVGGSILAFE